MSQIRTNIARLLGTAVLVTAALAATAPSVAASGATYRSGGFHCQWENGTRVVTAVAPRSMTSWYGGLEDVRWVPVLYHYTSQGWVVWRNKPGSLGVANANGLVEMAIGTTWVSAASTAYSATYWDFNNLPAGYYAIRNYYGWDRSPNGQAFDAKDWSLYNGYNYCYF
jgi:hypothetical protein